MGWIEGYKEKGVGHAGEHQHEHEHEHEHEALQLNVMHPEQPCLWDR